MFGSAIQAVDQPKQKIEKKPPGAASKIQVDLVSVNVSVTDKHGNPVTDLAAKDFRVFDEGVPQEITVFRVAATAGVVVMDTRTDKPSAEAASLQLLSRKVILFVDDYHWGIGSLARLKKAGEEFIQTGLSSADQVALITASGKYSTEFTKYRSYVIANRDKIFPISVAHRASTDCPPLIDYQAIQINRYRENAGDALTVAIADTIKCSALQGVPDAEQIAQSLVLASAVSRSSEILDDSRRTLMAVQTLSRRLRAIEGQKVLVFLSEGFLTRELEYQIQEAIDAAIRANTVVYSINALGLDATPPGGDSSFSPVTATATAPLRSQIESEERLVREDPLSALAYATGGQYLHNNNDLRGLLQNAVNRMQVSYLLGFYPTNPVRDGRFRKLVVKVSRPNVVVSARKGYFAPKGDEALEAEKNADVQEALQSPRDFTDIPVTLSYNVTPADALRALVAVQTRIDVRKIHFQKRENQNRNTFIIVTVVYDSSDRFLEGEERRIDFNLTDPSYKNVMEEGRQSQASFRLEPGNYKLKTVVREAGETKLGSATKTIEIMN